MLLARPAKVHTFQETLFATLQFLPVRLQYAVFRNGSLACKENGSMQLSFFLQL